MPVEPATADHCGRTWSVQRRIGAIRVVLRSQLKEVFRDFERIYPEHGAGGITSRGTPAAPCIEADYPAIEIRVRHIGWSRFGRRLFQVYADGIEVGGPRTANGVFPLVEWGINLRVLATRVGFLQIHAAAMALHGKGVVFAADSGCGKSTLAAILLSRGWQYLCDEFALIDPRSHALSPFPKALCIKAGSYRVVRRMGLRFARRRDFVKAFKGRVGYVDPWQRGSAAIGSVSPVRLVIFPEYRPGSIPKLHPIEPGRAALKLARCCLNPPNQRERTVAAMTNLLARATSFSLEVGEPQPTGRLLESVLDSDSAVAACAGHHQSATTMETAPIRVRKPLHSRRDILRLGAKLSYTAPLVLTLSASEAMAATSNPSGVCSTALNAGDLCEVDSDCCSEVCSLGVCE